MNENKECIFCNNGECSKLPYNKKGIFFDSLAFSKCPYCEYFWVNGTRHRFHQSEVKNIKPQSECEMFVEK
jgi:hypothetical protein